MTDGLVIAGGTSSRFGPQSVDKALVEVDGLPMIRRVVEALVPVVNRVVVNTRPAQVESYRTVLSDVACPTKFAVDRPPDCGPVAGLKTTLEAADSGPALVIACDYPLVESTTLSALDSRLQGDYSTDLNPPDSAPDCVLPIVDGKPQPLCGAYLLEAVGAAIDRLEETRNAPFRALLSQLDIATVRAEQLPGGSEVFKNVNTVDDLTALRNRETDGLPRA
jgi:molybdopterin-guanine dinucleotide biosynthesis protein A